jgi:hypothetical protein
VVNELNAKRPVILSGGRDTGRWIFGVYSDGHAWVCDDYIKINYTSTTAVEALRALNSTGIGGSSYSTLSLSMNWGWYNGSYNGFYAFDNFDPGEFTFNYRTKMVVIKR